MARLTSLSPPLEAILGDIVKYHYLTIDQILKLRQRRDTRSMQINLKYLSEEGYLLKIQRVGIVGHGSYKPVYALTGRGKAYLENIQNRIIRRVPRKSEELSQSVQLLEHTLAVNDVLTSLECLARDNPDTFRLDEMITERDMRRLFAGSGIETIADGFVKMLVNTTHGRFYQPILLELERTTAQDKQNWLSKVRRYSSLTEERIKAYFQVHTIEFAVVTLRPEDTRHLLAWTEFELKTSHKEEYEDLFRFITWDSSLDPLEFICGNRWAKPYSRNLYPLYADVKLY